MSDNHALRGDDAAGTRTGFPASLRMPSESLASDRLAPVSFLLIAAGLAALLYAASRPLHAGASWFAFVQDDCFYYLKVAQNLATGHGSTFNGINPTNGYHPLWLVCLTLFRMVFHSASFIGFIAFAVVLATLATRSACTVPPRRFCLIPYRQCARGIPRRFCHASLLHRHGSNPYHSTCLAFPAALQER